MQGLLNRENLLATDPGLVGSAASLSEDGFQRVAKLKDDVAMKAFINRVLLSEARYVTDHAQFNGFVPFYSGTKAHAAHKGAHKCDGGESVSEELCLHAAQQGDFLFFL